MKRLEKSLSKKLRPVCLFNDDVSGLVEIFERGCERLEIEASGYALDSISELEALNNEVINELRIVGREPYVVVHFKPSEVWLYTDGDSHQQIGILEEVKSYVHSKRRKLSLLTESSIIPPLLLGSLLSMLSTLKDETKTSVVILLVSMLFFSVLWLWWSFHSSFKRYSIIHTKRNRKDGGFIRRKRDDLLLNLFSASAGAVITLVLTWSFGQ